MFLFLIRSALMTFIIIDTNVVCLFAFFAIFNKNHFDTPTSYSLSFSFNPFAHAYSSLKLNQIFR